MELDPAAVAALLTAAGAPVAAGVIWAVIDFLKSIPGIGGVINGRERLAAFVGAIVVVVAALAVGFSEQPPRYAAVDLIFILGALLAIFNIGRLAMAMHDDVNRYPNSLTGTPERPA